MTTPDVQLDDFALVREALQRLYNFTSAPGRSEVWGEGQRALVRLEARIANAEYTHANLDVCIEQRQALEARIAEVKQERDWGENQLNRVNKTNQVLVLQAQAAEARLAEATEVAQSEAREAKARIAELGLQLRGATFSDAAARVKTLETALRECRKDLVRWAPAHWRNQGRGETLADNALATDEAEGEK